MEVFPLLLDDVEVTIARGRLKTHLGYDADSKVMVFVSSDIAAPANTKSVDEFLYLAHRCCWEVARCQLGQILSNQTMFAIAERTYPVLPVEDPWCDSESVGAFLGLETISTETNLGRLLHSVSCLLPLEIQNIIANSLGQDLVLSLLRAPQIARSYLRPLSSSSSSRMEAIEVPSSIRSLHVRTACIFGRLYLTKIAQQKKSPSL